ncbi:MAG: DNA polymerase III subunit alpha, partial [Alphaproteobacteria bacterium]
MLDTSGEAAGPFIHLHVHSAYSLLEGALPISLLARLAADDAMPALALTDTNNLFGALEFSEALAARGIQPIIGCALTVEFADTGKSTPAAMAAAGIERHPLEQNSGVVTLLAQNEAGYANLMTLASRAFLDTEQAHAPYVPLSALSAAREGLIALTGGHGGALDKAVKAGSLDIASKWLDELAAMFEGRLYVELQRYGVEGEAAHEQDMLQLAYDKQLPLVATNEAFFARPDDFDAHDALICISEGTYISADERRRLTPQHYFKTQAEMQRLFADLPEALTNTAEIAMRCAFRPRKRDPILPRSVRGTNLGEEGVLGEEAKALRAMAEAGLATRLEEEGAAPGFSPQDYRDRLERELQIIIGMRYPGYFLIVADFIQWAKKEGIPVGPGRGSGAGSLVAWALTITDLDPIRFGLLFERFLNPERVSMPDFDIDFCQEQRDEVIAYVQEKYGEDRVAQIITFGKLQARAVLRDVGRVLQMPYGQVDRLCKLVPNNPADPVTLPEAIAGEPKLQEERDSDPLVARLLDIGQKLEGLYRHASTHAAGIVIADRPLTELVPLYRDPRSPLPATQFNMKWVEAAGLVKFDFLGLKTLTVIEKAKQLIERDGTTIDIAKLPLDDRPTFDLLARAETVGVFQLESAGMRDALRKLKPDRFEDIIAMVALYRPGPMANIETYINRKHGKEKPDYLHPLIQPILEETYGVIIYQEQVMQIAQVLSGYTLGEADLLRRAMGKKIKSEMDQQKTRFVEGAVANGVDKAKA